MGQPYFRPTSSGTRPVPSNLSVAKPNGTNTATLTVATGWPTSGTVDIIMYSVDTSNLEVTGSKTTWRASISGTSLSAMSLVAGVEPSTGYAGGSSTVVKMGVTSSWADDVITGIRTHANDDGSLKPAAVKTALGVTSTTGGGWDILNAGTAPTVATGYNKGNKEFTLTFAGVDLTSTLSAGMRLKFDRGTTAPTQSMSFTAASSQYATKASPTGITFTGAFTTEAWVYLNSYTGTDAAAISRYDGTNGFIFYISGSGQVILNAGSTTNAISYQSVPLKRWVHISASFSAGTFNLYLNGILIQSTKSGAATTITQAGNLQIGAYNSTKFFDGYISEARVWSVAQTATQIQDNMAISLVGTETNLVALFQGNGTFTDKTSNANTLTATGGAIATQAANPYNTTEYAIVHKVAFATGNTTVTVFTGTDYNIPLGTLINPFSSFQKSPFGFNASRGKWRVDNIYLNGSPSTANAAKGSWYKLIGSDFTVPTGEWGLEWSGVTVSLNGTPGTCVDKFQLDTATPVNNRENQVPNETKFAGDSNFPAYAKSPVETVVNTASTVYSMYAVTVVGAGANSTLTFDMNPVFFTATSAWI